MSSSTTHISVTSALPEDADADRSANSPSPSVTSVEGRDSENSPSSSGNSSIQSAEYWASLIRQSYNALYSGGTLDTEFLNAPRRRHAGQDSATLAHKVAGLLYPNYSDSNIPQVIKYEKDVVLFRKAIRARQKADEMDEVKDPLPLPGAPALPMLVTISDEESLAAFFNHLSIGGTHDTLNGSKLQEPYQDVDVAKFEKGILYEDGRMDLCKIYTTAFFCTRTLIRSELHISALGSSSKTNAVVISPPNISQVMTSLESHTFVRYFLLWIDLIGPVGARLISDFVFTHPDRMETWYLAGNCIDLAGFERLVSARTMSTSITNIWLKRNPLGPKASTDLYDLITRTSQLRTLDLDLDQTKLGDEGVAHLFSLLANHHNTTSLRHIYLNAVGKGQCACKSLATYLSSPHCTIRYLPESSFV
ncbi:MAG: hypothetical protein ALECFALPRED_000455 [Alectoria fallacina]|uniref:RNI-like protein n=1 Tax=Alectoria fallacina TaxID=1903189 RepID=A0A8H3F6G7_9LECA|nr:MAG: hypothetical protein ALECFALPRED_000455 [Alectoria fallacina]